MKKRIYAWDGNGKELEGKNIRNIVIRDCARFERAFEGHRRWKSGIKTIVSGGHRVYASVWWTASGLGAELRAQRVVDGSIVTVVAVAVSFLVVVVVTMRSVAVRPPR